MKIFVVLLTILIVGGCATASRTYLPSGAEGHSITCSGSVLTWGHCYEKAGELCGQRGYEVITQSGEQGAVAAAGQFGAFGGSTFIRNMLIKCN